MERSNVVAEEVMAANAEYVLFTLTTPADRSVLTEDEFPPFVVSPHVINLPSFRNAANAALTMYIPTIPADISVATELEVPPYVVSPHVITFPLLFNAANA